MLGSLKAVPALIVYQAEAHAADEWPVGPTLSDTAQHQTTEERIEAARRLVDRYQVTNRVVVAPVDSALETTWGAWPFRYYVVEAGRLRLKAEPDPTTHYYSLDQLAGWLAR